MSAQPRLEPAFMPDVITTTVALIKPTGVAAQGGRSVSHSKMAIRKRLDEFEVVISYRACVRFALRGAARVSRASRRRQGIYGSDGTRTRDLRRDRLVPGIRR